MSWFSPSLDDLAAQLVRIERNQKLILRALKLERIENMASQEALDKLTTQVAANTVGVAAAAAALTGFVATVADLTQKLQDAISSGDEAAVQAAADAIEQNNATLTAAIPTVAAAVVEGTPAA